MQVAKIHFTTKDLQEVLDDNKKKIFSMFLVDPEPRVPEGFDLFDDCQLGEYMLVDGSTIKGWEKSKKYVYKAVEGMVLTKDWEFFEDNMKVQDLIDLEDNFLIYYQCLSVTTKANQTSTTDRNKTRTRPGSSGSSSSSSKRPTRGKK
jgi:hypothetical protein